MGGGREVTDGIVGKGGREVIEGNGIADHKQLFASVIQSTINEH